MTIKVTVNKGKQKGPGEAVGSIFIPLFITCYLRNGSVIKKVNLFREPQFKTSVNCPRRCLISAIEVGKSPRLHLWRTYVYTLCVCVCNYRAVEGKRESIQCTVKRIKTVELRINPAKSESLKSRVLAEPVTLSLSRRGLTLRAAVPSIRNLCLRPECSLCYLHLLMYVTATSFQDRGRGRMRCCK